MGDGDAAKVGDMRTEMLRVPGLLGFRMSCHFYDLAFGPSSVHFVYLFSAARSKGGKNLVVTDIADTCRLLGHGMTAASRT